MHPVYLFCQKITCIHQVMLFRYTHTYFRYMIMPWKLLTYHVMATEYSKVYMGVTTADEGVETRGVEGGTSIETISGPHHHNHIWAFSKMDDKGKDHLVLHH